MKRQHPVKRYLSANGIEIFEYADGTIFVHGGPYSTDMMELREHLAAAKPVSHGEYEEHRERCRAALCREKARRIP